MAFFDTLKNSAKTAARLTGTALRASNPLLSTGFDLAKRTLQQPAAPRPQMPQEMPADGSFPQLGPMSMPTTPVAQQSFGAPPVMPQVKAPVAPTYSPPIVQSQDVGYTFKPTLSSAQVSSLQSLATKPQDQWTATDKANWAYGTNNGAMPTVRPPLPPMEETSGPTVEAPKPEESTPAPMPSISPETQKAVESSQALYEKSLQISPEELSSQADVDRLMESARKGFVNAQQQAIPMEFITGQLKSIEDRANTLLEPLQSRLARLQAQRTAAITASKFALERADAKAAEEKAAAEKVRQEKLDISKPIEVGGSIVQLNPKTGKYDVLYQAPEKPATSGDFSLSPGESRYDASRNLIATAGASSKPVPVRGLTAEQTNLISQGNNLPSLLNPLLADIDANQSLFGPIAGRAAGLNPNNVAAQSLQAKLNTAAQVVGTYLEGGKLAEGDISRYRTILPQLTDTPEVAKNKLKAVEKLIKDKQSQYFRDFQSAGYDTSGFNSGPTGGQNDPLGLGFNQESQTSKKGPLASSHPIPSKVIQTSTGTYDFSTYATDPNWGNAVKSHISRIPQLNSSQDITAFIRSQAPNSPITGDMVLASAKKFNVDPKLILAIAKQEANYATLGRAARTFNPGNVGNVDSGANVNWGSWQNGLDALARNVSRRITNNQA